MEPIDNDIQTIATISLLQLPDKKYKLNNGTETDRITVAAKIGRCHFEMREKHNELTGRSLSRIFISINNCKEQPIEYSQIMSALIPAYNKKISEIDSSQYNQDTIDAFDKEVDSDLIDKLTKINENVAIDIDMKKLDALIEEAITNDKPIIGLYSILQHTKIQLIKKDTVVKMKDMLKMEFENVKKPNWYIDKLYLQRMINLLEKITDMDESIKARDLGTLLSSQSSDSTLEGVRNDILFFSKTYPTYGKVLPEHFAKEKIDPKLVTDENKNDIFRYPNLYFNVDGIDSISDCFNELYKPLFEEGNLSFSSCDYNLLSKFYDLISIFMSFGFLPSQTIVVDEVANSLSSTDLSNIIEIMKIIAKEIPMSSFSFSNLLKKFQNTFNERIINTEDERNWYNHNDPELSDLFELTRKLVWVPIINNQEEIIKQVKLNKPRSYDKLQSYVTNIDPDNEDIK
ncbi:hypothetical protein TVAG_079540 [Trichomonas vaginalis G3]|uniref:Uncharacterized protein n=1 Tax=Trichomonas vaginalis (strain ATCC PRA-98 / G3) TaxID=412133 RepID=A2EF86_TRIV3|nr:nuclear chaperone required for maturation and nuclear export of pre-60s ribosome subunits [Trichomonas vaginalis G3]EAY08696.1 hypothetical protein TVAG_079540 [Trichomonas vaginalis G3]KAI5492823.1 nuclear chaperone required for maturation and nuclear export of pre-60s ribosome subunits [Trichomonas vaginalis G3]|eukprot:XP_001320919.1 hypothetical protein [Trichomonas vaginalis G3]